jgi:hypothetical protein
MVMVSVVEHTPDRTCHRTHGQHMSSTPPDVLKYKHYPCDGFQDVVAPLADHCDTLCLLQIMHEWVNMFIEVSLWGSGVLMF